MNHSNTQPGKQEEKQHLHGDDKQRTRQWEMSAYEALRVNYVTSSRFSQRDN
ncbi:MAG: hypothetical protein R3183_03780 [Oleiphilaceae bacterium]|nr:hypothetical protein [Oleiphilaceae bacterium]